MLDLFLRVKKGLGLPGHTISHVSEIGGGGGPTFSPILNSPTQKGVNKNAFPISYNSNGKQDKFKCVYKLQ